MFIHRSGENAILFTVVVYRVGGCVMPNVTVDFSYAGPSPFLSSLIFGTKWDVGQTLTYFIEPTDWDQNGVNDWIQTGAINGLRSAYAAWSAVCNLQTAEVGAIELANYSEQIAFPFPGGSSSHALPSNFLGFGFYQLLGSEQSFGVGHNGNWILLHEVGHGLGLVHPHSSPAFPGVTGEYDPGDFDLNNVLYSVMSYVQPNGLVGDERTATYGNVAGPMAFDIAAVQAMYGANMTVATGATIYDIPTANVDGTAWRCIWDAGGIDTLRYSGNGACTIDLRAATLLNEPGGGGWLSRADGISGGFTIANGVVIENATGGNGVDKIIGNSAANMILGNGGSDVLRGEGGADILTGGAGADVFVYHRITDSSAAARDLITDFTVGIDRLDFTLLPALSFAVSQAGGQTLLSAVTVQGTLEIAFNGLFTLDQLLPERIAPQLGDAAANSLLGTTAADHIFGLEGNDSIDGGDSGDLLVGGLGVDQLNGGLGDDIIYGGTGQDGLIDPEGADVLNGGAGDDRLYGELGADLLFGGSGNDELWGGAGDDRLDAGVGNDVVDGGTGHDVLVISDAGSVAAWSINGMSYAGLAQRVGARIDFTSIEAMQLSLGNGADLVYLPFRGENVVDAGGGDDRIFGGVLFDRLFGGDGNDSLDGGFGSDWLEGGAGTDVLNGNEGIDRARYASAGAGVTVDLRIVGAQDTGAAGFDALLSIEDLEGSAFADTLIGSNQINYLDGGAGNDLLTGGGGNDRIEGGAGTNDFATYSGSSADYLIEQVIIDGILHYRVIGQGAAIGDGIDLLTGVEFLRFANMDLRISNAAPTLGSPAIPDQNAGDGALYSYQIPLGSFIDADGDPLSFIATLADGSPLPGWLSFNAAARTFSGTPPFGAIGTVLQIKITAADNVPGYPTSFVSDVFALSIFEAPGADINGTSGVDSLSGTFRSERMFGLDSDDNLLGSLGTDLLDGGNGSDTADYYASASGVTVNLLAGIGSDGDAQGDSFVSIENVRGSTFADSLNGSAAANILNGNGGADNLFGGAGHDRLILGAGANGSVIDGGADSDTLVINSSVSSLAGLTGIEALELVGGSVLTLTQAQFNTGLAANTVVSGIGTITVAMTSPGDFVSKLYSFIGSGVAFVVNGSSGNDIIKLGNAPSTVNTGDGSNTVQGGNLVDRVIGGAGVDKIAGNGGADILTGGAGADVFKFRSISDSISGNSDTITDYAIGIDKLNFSRIDTNPGLAGDQGFAFIGNAFFVANGTAQIRYTSAAGDLLVQADANGDGIGDMEIILAGRAGCVLTAADFVL
jgi:Ca2+-binding RTX toxin-like protein